MDPQKKIKIRACHVLSSEVTYSPSVLLEALQRVLNSKPTIRDRKRQINDVDSEVISSFSWGPSRRYLFATLVRIRRDDLRNPLSESVLDQPSFSIRDLSDSHEGETYKDHFYFLTDGRYLVTNLSGTSSLARITIYLNWILTDVRGGGLYDLQPSVRPPDAVPLRDLKSVEIGRGGTSFSIQTGRSIFDLTSSLTSLLQYLPGIGDAQEVIDKGLIGAKLVLSFKSKPRDMDTETYQSLVGGLAALGNEEQGITVIDKKGRKYTGSDIAIIKEVSIEVVDEHSRLVDEEALKQEMEGFLGSIPNLIEDTTT